MKQCKICKKQFEPVKVWQIYCNSVCKRIVKNNNRKKQLYNCSCYICGQIFSCRGQNNKQRYCSQNCKYEADKARMRQPLIEKKCQYRNCNNIIRDNKKRFCCKQCARKERYKLNPQKHTICSMKYIANNINAKIAKNLRIRLYHAICGKYKTGSAVKDLGCTIGELKIYFENKFEEGMTWNNYGSVWHIDHIKPLSKFDLTMCDQILEAVNYTNLQPLFAKDNLSKSNKWKEV